MSTRDIKEFKLLVKKIEKSVNKIKVKTKVTVNRMQTIKSKIEKQIELIRVNASQVSTIDNLESLSLSQSISDDISHIDETMIDV